MPSGIDGGTVSLVDWVGRRAHRPSVAAAVVAATAVAFTVGWFLLLFPETFPDAVVLVVATVANAFVVTWVIWTLFVPDGVWEVGAGFKLGLAVGIVSHVTVGFAWALPIHVLGGDPTPLVEVVWRAIWLSGWSVPMTFGIPVALSVGAALWLTACRRRAVEH